MLLSPDTLARPFFTDRASYGVCDTVFSSPPNDREFDHNLLYNMKWEKQDLIAFFSSVTEFVMFCVLCLKLIILPDCTVVIFMYGLAGLSY